MKLGELYTNDFLQHIRLKKASGCMFGQPNDHGGFSFKIELCITNAAFSDVHTLRSPQTASSYSGENRNRDERVVPVREVWNEYL